jgi:hypothetical protein
MDVRTLRLLIADALEVGVDFVPMKIRTVEDLADLIEQQEKSIAELKRSLLDDFAMAALTGIVSADVGGNLGDEDVVIDAYSIAHKMYERRQSLLSADDQPTKES